MRELRRQLAAAQAQPPVRVEVPVLTKQDADALRELTGRLENIVAALHSALSAPTHTAVVTDRLAAPHAATDVQPAAAAPVAAPNPRAAMQLDTRSPSSVGLKAGARRMLDVLARQHPLRITRAQLATLAGLNRKGGTYNTYFSTLRRNGLITEHDTLIGLSEHGLAEAGITVTHAPMTTDEIRTQWRSVLKLGARTMLDIVLGQYPAPISRADLAAQANLEATGGTFNTYLSVLRSNGLVVVANGQITASKVFFLNRAPAA